MDEQDDRWSDARTARIGGVVLAVLVLLGCTVTLARAAHDHARDEARTEQRQSLALATAALRSTLEGTLVRADDVATLLGGTAGARWPTARTRLFGDPAIFGAGYAVVVGPRGRTALERRLGARLQEPGPNGTLLPARARSRYVVPVAVAYRDGSRAGLGVNLAAEPERATTLARAATRGTAQLTPPVSLVGTGEQAVVTYSPVRDRGRLVAYLIASYRTAQLLARTRSVLPADLAMRVSEGTAPLASSANRLDHPATSTIDVGGRRITVAVGRGPVATGGTLAIAGGGTLITVLVALLLAGSVREARRAATRGEEQRRGRQRAESQFTAAFEQAPIGMALIALDGTTLRANEALATLTGCPTEVLAGGTLSALTHPDDRRTPDELLRALDESGTVAAEQRIIDAEGRVRWVANTTTLLRDDAGTAEALLVQLEDVTDRRAYEQRLQDLANRDPLTGLLNRRAFLADLDRHVALERRYGGDGAVLLLDLDHFKAVNDTLGHSAGDRVLIEAAHRLRHRLRESDTLARLGGDELAILLPAVSAAEAQDVAVDLLGVLGEVTIPHHVAQPLSASIGIAMIGGEDGPTGEDLLVRADLALYDAKDGGRGRVETYAPADEHTARTEARISWVQRLHRALAEDRFVLHYQPLTDLRSGEVRAFEALLRMCNDDGDLVMPASYLPIAERHGLAPQIDRWVFRHVLEDAARLHAAGNDAQLSINVSAHSIGDPAFVPDIEALMESADVPPGRLILEITETAAISDLPMAQAFARRMRALGCRLALDDFGAGFGSFYYLKHLPFDMLKIDGEFVRTATAHALDRRIIESIVRIAHASGSVTVAEHIPSAESVQLMRMLAVDLGQGYHLGAPAPLETFLEGAGARR